MSLPVDQRIVDALAAGLAAITVANGYHSDAGLHVFTDESRDELPADAIALSVIDESEELTSQGCDNRRGILNVRIEVLVPHAPVLAQPTRAMARLVLADVRQAIASLRKDFCKGATSLELAARRLLPREDGSPHLVATLDVRVTFFEQHL